MKRFFILSVVLTLAFFSSCVDNRPPETVGAVDPLPSWNSGKNKEEIVRYVELVTDTASNDFIPITHRIAVFDNDGTLWSEQPLYFQLIFVVDRVKQMSKDHPEWKQEEPFKTILEQGLKGLLTVGKQGIGEALLATHTGMSVSDFQNMAKQWADTAKNPMKHVLYTGLVYQPMLELMDYLRQNKFKIYIVSGGSVEFMRPIISNLYGIPSEQIIGTTFKTEYEYNNGHPVIMRIPEIEFNNDKEGKPVNIQKIIGKKPIFAAGNSDGDLAMLQWTASNRYKSLKLYVHHTDSVREWAYDRNSHIGKLDKGLDQALADGWHVVDMKNDWKNIFPFEKKKN